ncbi:MAG: glycosyl hydrolase [Armatimonadetes bacterium]|nr:glycosyl hydrolase [Armatimonadota bacterium]
MKRNRIIIACATLAASLGALTCGLVAVPSVLEANFATPPASARPWVYWFWLNGNITREGITADLQAMKRVGIGGVLIMEVDQGAPVGPVDFMGPKWRELFKYVVSEANRLGLEVNMNNDAGWNGSGGPWIKPEESMQKVVCNETEVEGPQHFESNLPQPETIAGFYRDIEVLALPVAGSYRIPDIGMKACYGVGFPGGAESTKLPAEMLIDSSRIVDLTAKLDKDGKLVWDVPAGKWTILRFGHTSTGAQNGPAPATGRGLECDKLSREGSEAAFNGMMAKLISDVGPLAGKSLVSTHIDSWEIGAQNWTAKMREEFTKRRGYDPLPWLPVMTGRAMGSLEMSERFLWDLRQMISELVVENYAGHTRNLANKYGVRLSIEAYGGPCADLPYAGRADEPMCEFWMEPYRTMMETAKEMSSAAHTYGKRVVGAEAFTSTDAERWRQYPATIKALGDEAMCDGVNRFVFHRYAMQPWTNPDRVPGMSMGPWGVHYEHTQTWWEMSGPWHEYLSRCHYMLRQGLFVADICYLHPEEAPQGPRGHERRGYDFDNISAEALLTRVQVKDGRLALPDGMSYRVLALPDTRSMTPKTLSKIRDLVNQGATVVGKLPAKSPSLSGYPQCDSEVKKLADEIAATGKVTEQSPEEALAKMGVSPDFASDSALHYIHRTCGDSEVYFVANPHSYPVSAVGTFRVSGMEPEIWDPETGHIEQVAQFSEKGGCTSVPLTLNQSGSVFVVFRKHTGVADRVVGISRNGKALTQAGGAKITVVKAVYGVLDDPKRTRDVRARVQVMLDRGQYEFDGARLADGDDPAFGIVKTAIIDYTVDGKQFTATGKDTDMIALTSSKGLIVRAADIHRDLSGTLALEAWQPGRYTVKMASGKTMSVDVSSIPRPKEIAGPWQVAFDSRWGGPGKTGFARLDDWSKRSEEGIKYYSGTAVYRTTFKYSGSAKSRVFLDLGKVAVMAEVRLNGKSAGIAWKSPYRVEISGIIKAGANDLEVKVANLPINRMIGDEQLPEDSERNGDGTLRSWPKWLEEGKPSPSGRFTFAEWRLYRKGDPLQESGLLGPVTIQTAVQVIVN